MSGMKPFNWEAVERIFLTSRPDSCPYLPNLNEQKLVTLIQKGDSEGFAELTNNGFRRSHDAAYQPICPDCQACQPLRVRALDFQPNKTQRRLIRKYDALHLSLEAPVIDHEHWVLFTKYVQGRHGGGSMANMTRQDFAAMVSDTPVKTKLLTWRKGSAEGPLVAACLADLLPDGLSAVYSYFSLNPSYPSLGTFVILSLIATAAKAELPHVHLGYWVKGSKKMAYKAQFSPAEICINGAWQALPKNNENY